MKDAFGKTIRRTPFQRELDNDLEGLRDDCIALFLNSGLRQKDIHQAGGPTPGTISKWLYKETMFPRYSTIASFTRALGCRIAIVEKSIELPNELKGKAIRSGKPRMPARKKRKAKLRLVGGRAAA